jgi:hypothetical protein
MKLYSETLLEKMEKLVYYIFDFATHTDSIKKMDTIEDDIVKCVLKLLCNQYSIRELCWRFYRLFNEVYFYDIVGLSLKDPNNEIKKWEGIYEFTINEKSPFCKQGYLEIVLDPFFFLSFINHNIYTLKFTFSPNGSENTSQTVQGNKKTTRIFFDCKGKLDEKFKLTVDATKHADFNRL